MKRIVGFVFQLIADDDVRDYGHPEKGPELRKQWEDMGFHVISMRDDWKTIYGENVVRTGEFHWLEDYSDDKISEKQAAWPTIPPPLNPIRWCIFRTTVYKIQRSAKIPIAVLMTNRPSLTSNRLKATRLISGMR